MDLFRWAKRFWKLVQTLLESNLVVYVKIKICNSTINGLFFWNTHTCTLRYLLLDFHHSVCGKVKDLEPIQCEFSGHQQGVLQFNLTLILIPGKTYQIPQVRGSVLRDCPTSLQWSPKSLDYHLCFWQTDYSLEVQMPPALGLINLLTAAENTQKHFTY